MFRLSFHQWPPRRGGARALRVTALSPARRPGELGRVSLEDVRGPPNKLQGLHDLRSRTRDERAQALVAAEEALTRAEAAQAALDAAYEAARGHYERRARSASGARPVREVQAAEDELRAAFEACGLAERTARVHRETVVPTALVTRDGAARALVEAERDLELVARHQARQRAQAEQDEARRREAELDDWTAERRGP